MPMLPRSQHATASDHAPLPRTRCKARESKLEEFEQDLVFVEGRAAASLQLQGNPHP